MILKTLITISAITNVGAVVLDDKTTISIASVISIGFLVWYLGRMLQKMQDDIRNLTKAVNQLPCRQCRYIEDRPKGEDDSA